MGKKKKKARRSTLAKLNIANDALSMAGGLSAWKVGPRSTDAEIPAKNSVPAVASTNKEPQKTMETQREPPKEESRAQGTVSAINETSAGKQDDSPPPVDAETLTQTAAPSKLQVE